MNQLSPPEAAKLSSLLLCEHVNNHRVFAFELEMVRCRGCGATKEGKGPWVRPFLLEALATAMAARGMAVPA